MQKDSWNIINNLYQFFIIQTLQIMKLINTKKIDIPNHYVALMISQRFKIKILSIVHTPLVAPFIVFAPNF